MGNVTLAIPEENELRKAWETILKDKPNQKMADVIALSQSHDLYMAIYSDSVTPFLVNANDEIELFLSNEDRQIWDNALSDQDRFDKLISTLVGFQNLRTPDFLNTKTIFLPKEVSECLERLAKAANLDGGYGEFDLLITTIISEKYDMSPTDFLNSYTWEQPDGFSGAVHVRKK